MATQTRADARPGQTGFAGRSYADTEHEAMVADHDAGVWDTEGEAINAVRHLIAEARSDGSDLTWYGYVSPGEWLDDDGLIYWWTDHDVLAVYVPLVAEDEQ